MSLTTHPTHRRTPRTTPQLTVRSGLGRRVAAGVLLSAALTGGATAPAVAFDGPRVAPVVLRFPHLDTARASLDPSADTAASRVGPVTPAWVTPVATRTSPVAGDYPISAPYGLAGGWAAGYHTGVDLATPVGTPVRSVGPGTVVLAGDAGDYGNAVMVRLTDGYYALYAHLSAIDVRVGDPVATGTRLGATGDTGNATGPHLHFEIRTGATYGTDVDPLAYLAHHGVGVG